jgi:hypothetical protein
MRRGQPRTPVADLRGAGLDGMERTVRLSGGAASPWTLLLFLSSECEGCGDLWPLLTEAALPRSVRVVAVVRAVGEDEARLVELEPPGGLVLASEAAWEDYGVLGAPFYVLVSRSSPAVMAESVAWGAEQLVAHVASLVASGTSPDAR